MAQRLQHFKMLARQVAGFSADTLFPPVCPGCKRHVAVPGTLCGECWPTLQMLERPWCDVFGTPFSHDMGKGFLSAEAIANPPPFERARAAVAYVGLARDMVQGLKYRDQTDLAPWMARWMVRAGSELLSDAEVVIPVPLHWMRMMRRGFNQSAELARAIARQTEKPFAPQALQRIKRTRHQVGLAIREREDNVRAAFRVPPEREIDIGGRRVLLVDDVYTTGATVFAATKALKRAGARTVDVLTFARVLPGAFRQDDPETI